MSHVREVHDGVPNQPRADGGVDELVGGEGVDARFEQRTWPRPVRCRPASNCRRRLGDEVGCGPRPDGCRFVVAVRSPLEAATGDRVDDGVDQLSRRPRALRTRRAA
jgi:hypothetical protein